MHHRRRLTRLWMACLFCLSLLTYAPVSSGRRPTDADVPALAGDLKDKDPQVRAAAAGMLYALAEKAKGAVPTLIEFLKDDDKHTRWLALKVRERIRPGVAAVPALLGLLKDEDRHIHMGDMGQLGGIGASALIREYSGDAYSRQGKNASGARRLEQGPLAVGTGGR